MIEEKDFSQGEYLYTSLSRNMDGIITLKVVTRLEEKLREEEFQGRPDKTDPDRFCEYHLCPDAVSAAGKGHRYFAGLGHADWCASSTAGVFAIGKEYGDKQIREHLHRDYFVTDEKIDLLLRTANKEKQILDLSRPESFSLYLSIPFCPSRCHYCSFVSHSVERAKKLIPEYVTLLIREIEYVAPIVQKRA